MAPRPRVERPHHLPSATDKWKCHCNSLRRRKISHLWQRRNSGPPLKIIIFAIHIMIIVHWLIYYTSISCCGRFRKAFWAFVHGHVFSLPIPISLQHLAEFNDGALLYDIRRPTWWKLTLTLFVTQSFLIKNIYYSFTFYRCIYLLPCRSARFNGSETRLLCFQCTIRPNPSQLVHNLPTRQQQSKWDLKQILLKTEGFSDKNVSAQACCFASFNNEWPFHHRMTTTCSFGRCQVKTIANALSEVLSILTQNTPYSKAKE